MSESIYIRLANILEDLARLLRVVQPEKAQLELENIIDRLDAMIEETIGLETPAPEEDAHA